MANHYIFFDEGLAGRFVDFAATLDLVGKQRPDPVEGVVVELPEDLSDETQEALEERYDELMDEQRELVEAADDSATVVMGIDLTLPDGSVRKVILPASLGRRLNEHFSGEEIHALVASIAESLTDASTEPLCCRF